MPVRKRKEEPDERIRIQNFYQRWNIELSEEQKWLHFFERVLNAYCKEIGQHILLNLKSADEFFRLIGVHGRPTNMVMEADREYDEKLLKSPVYNFFRTETDTKRFILALEVIFWMDSIDFRDKYDFLEAIQDAIVTTGVPLEVKETDEDVLFYPAGARLLDQKLVNDNLEWLQDYPSSYKAFKEALLQVGEKGKERQITDNLRLSFEMLLHGVFKNSKSLENQKEPLFKYLKAKSATSQISNLFWTVFDYFCKYQNENVKHADTVKADEVEFILYLTGTLMRFLLTR